MQTYNQTKEDKAKARLMTSVTKFMGLTDKLAKKYKATISISSGDKEVVLADYKNEK